LQNDNPTLDSLRVLHLEDDPNDAELVRLNLSKAFPKTDVTWVKDQPGFLDAAKTPGFDVILLDYALPGFTGIDALEILKERSLSVPVIFVSATQGEEIAVSAIKKGAVDYIPKNQLGRLGPAIERALQEIQERRARRLSDEQLRQSQHELAAITAAESLRASANHYRLLFESNPTPILLYEQETLAFLSVNEAAVRHYGFTREEFRAMSLADVAIPEEIPAFVQRLSSLTAEAGNSGIWRHRKKDGKFAEMEITSHPITFGDKKAWLSLAIDVTERLNLEAQLRQSQKMESVGQLAGGIAHDFNNLLTVISGHTGIMLVLPDLPAKVNEHLKEISEATKRAADLTRQLLTFSRKNVLQPVVMDLNEAVNNIGKMLRRILGEDIALEMNFSPSLPSVKADLGMIEQVLLNLAVNSRDAMPRGGKLRIATASVMIDRAHVAQNPEASTGRYICLTFADSGCGIPPEHLPRIFEPFFTTKELDRGTGLGLATVYGIIKQHQGWIEVTSRVNQGTSFQIYLPASNEKSGALSPSAGEQRVIGGTETLLVVEDEAPLLKLIHHILESYGYEVLGCSSGKAALELWGEHRKKIDLLLTDMILPDGMAGPELAQILQASKPDLKVVYTSGYNTEKLARDFTLDRNTNFIQKPFHARKLAETVYDCLNGK
jgi:two-component system, cell cycle sensor histidine kinase and response regulator CckA